VSPEVLRTADRRPRIEELLERIRECLRARDYEGAAALAADVDFPVSRPLPRDWLRSLAADVDPAPAAVDDLRVGARLAAILEADE
jgi:hypothetical protein